MNRDTPQDTTRVSETVTNSGLPRPMSQKAENLLRSQRTEMQNNAKARGEKVKPEKKPKKRDRATF